MKKLFVLFLCLFVSDSFATGMGAVLNASCDNATLDKYNGTVNTEINWEPNTIQLNWYDGDTKLDVANTSQSCVYDGNISVPPAPTKPGYTFNGWKIKKVMTPSGYTQLQYLESYGNNHTTGSYIDTGVKFDVNSRIELKFNVPTYLGNYAIFGASNGDYYNEGEISLFYNAYSNNNPFFEPVRPLSNTSSEVVSINSRPQCVVNTDYTTIMDKNSVTINNRAYTTAWYASYQGNRTVYLFGTNRGSSSWMGGNTRIYYFKIWNNNTLVRDFVPARRNSDNVLGMWDIVSEQFFTNQGNGNFTGGPAVQ